MHIYLFHLDCIIYVLAQLTMSARAFPITLGPSVYLAVRLLDYFSKPISSYSFNRIDLKFYSDDDHKIGYLACAFLTIGSFLNFWRMSKISEIMV